MSDTSEKGNLLTNVFHKSRRDRGGSSEGGDSVKSIGTASSSQRRSSIESTTSKLKGPDGASVLKKLVPDFASKRRQKKEQEQAQKEFDEGVLRGRRVADRGVLDDHIIPTLNAEDSTGSGSSQVTYESEDDT